MEWTCVFPVTIVLLLSNLYIICILHSVRTLGRRSTEDPSCLNVKMNVEIFLSSVIHAAVKVADEDG